jgi:hypothetical protein
MYRPINTLNTEIYIRCIKLILKSLMFIIMHYMNYMKETSNNEGVILISQNDFLKIKNTLFIGV